MILNPKQGTAFLAIPSTVIFQKCVATSPKAVRRLIYGEIDKIIDPNHGYVDDSSTYYVNLFKQFQDREAKAMANLVADPVGIAEYRRFRQSLSVARANEDRSRRWGVGAHLKMSIPFSNSVELTVRGKPIPLSRNGNEVAAWGFLATQIVELQTTLVFDRLVVDRKNRNFKGDNADSPDHVDAWVDSPKQPVDGSGDSIPIAVDEEPIDALEAVCLETAGDFAAIGLETVRERTLTQKYRNRKLAPAQTATHTGVAAAGDGKSGATGAAPVDLPPHEPPRPPVTLDQFLELLDVLRERGYAVRTLVTAQAHRKSPNHTWWINFLPKTIKGVRSWHLSSEAEDAQPRGYIVAAIYRGATWNYFIELERKGAEALSICHLRLNNGGQLPEPMLQRFMIDVARTNGWGCAHLYISWIVETIRHKPSQGIGALADAMLQRI